MQNILLPNDIPLDDDPIDNKYMVDIRVAQRTIYTYITTVEGLPNDLNITRIMKYMTKVFSCGGTIVDSKIIKLQGDQRDNVRQFLTNENIVNSENIIVHGF